MVFTSIGHLINKDLLISCHEGMDGKKAVGIDGISKDDYDKNLNENLDILVEKLKHHTYFPRPAKRIEIPKDNGKTRPLSIYCYEDKLVQEALRRILEAVFEPHFYNEMMGFRPNRSCHQASRYLGSMIETKKVNYMLDADISGFFDHLDHNWIMKFIGARIKDTNILRLIWKMLKSGIIHDYVYEDTEEGSGQGSVCSPIIANIYMHYVLVWWLKERVMRYFRGYCGLIVYADDFVIGFQYKEDAEKFYELLKNRMERFGLSLQEEKTRLIEFGRFANENRARHGLTKAETFTFLGFTYYCSKSRNGKFRVMRKTSKKKLIKKRKELHLAIRDMRNWKLKAIMLKLNQILVGYYHYYGVTDNIWSIQSFYHYVLRDLFYWLNRRGQRKSYSWEGFNRMLTAYPLAKPKIYVNLYTHVAVE